MTNISVAPFNDEMLYIEQYNKANFWYQACFHSVDLTSLREAAMKEYFRQPIVDTFDIRICQAKSIRHSVDFLQAAEEDLHVIGEEKKLILLLFLLRIIFYRNSSWISHAGDWNMSRLSILVWRWI